MSNLGRKLTLVVTITDPETAKWIWEALDRETNGVKACIIANGDQVTVPGNILEAVSQLDDFAPDRKELGRLIAEAEAFQKAKAE